MSFYKDKLGNLYLELHDKVYVKLRYSWFMIPSMEELNFNHGQFFDRMLRIAEFNGDILDLKEAVLQ